MLIYVNKKQEKYKKIKILSLILCGFLILVINICCFKKSIHTPIRDLTQYNSLKISQNWYDKAQTVTVFMNKKSPQAVIVIPAKLNKENFITTIVAIHKIIGKNTKVSFTKEVKKNNHLKEIAEFLSSNTRNKTSKNLLITTDYKKAEPLVFAHKLFPCLINYKQAQKQQISTRTQPFLKKFFPTPNTPNTFLDKEKRHLKSFAKDYAKELKNIIFSKNAPSFFAQNLFLQNAKICLQNKTQTVCRTSSELSLEKNLIKAASAFPKKTPPEKLIFLTSEQKINTLEPLEADEGLSFTFGSKKTILLPKQISALAKQKDALYILKKQAGLNPDYTATDMNFYKFKTMEININDDI